MTSNHSSDERHFERLVQTANTGVLIVSSDETIQYANPYVEDIFGHSPDTLIGKPFSELLSENTDETDQSEIEAHVPNSGEHQSTQTVQLRGRHSEGHKLFLDVVFSAFEGDDSQYVSAIIRDITDHRFLETQLKALTHLSREHKTADSSSTICDSTVTAASTLFEQPIVAIELYDDEAGRLEPCSWASEVDNLTTDGRLFRDDRSLPWSVFAKQETQVIQDLSASDETDTEKTPLQSVLIHSIGSHGVFIVGATDAQAFSESDTALANLLVSNTYAALDRISREHELEEEKEELEEETQALDRVQRLNNDIRDLTKVLTNSHTRPEITEEICTRLAASEPYEFAWFGALDPGSNEVVPEAFAGNGDTYLDGVTITVDEELTETDHEPIGHAIHDRTPQVDNSIQEDPPFESWRQSAIQHGYRSTIAVPVVHQDTLYGILSLYATESGVFDQLEVAVLQEFGEMIGYALNAEERRQAFTSEQSVELAFEVHERTDSLFAMTTEVAGEFHLENLVERRDGRTTMFFANKGGDPQEVVKWADNQSDISNLRLLTDRDEECLFECVLEESTVWSQLLQRGAMVIDAVADSDSTRIVIRIPRSADPRAFDALLEERLGDVDLVARREYDEPIMTAQEFEAEYRDRLTERQDEVLQTAYYAGYFEWPRETKSGELADILGIAQPTVSRHIRASEDEFLSMVYEDEAE
ncbi:bacterio-opsin activator domain-containing protein [Natrarchaeobius chitinivorans]|uniref:bacterio-opsin activator domain-containing protein n=1 Tax=Natrarchaeobius chitinivorans TaxID=1679083 RepID=UPI001405219E|nr:bacterio-opsin activator domain-containing protein [Natrarchaeobius chitinivorans]